MVLGVERKKEYTKFPRVYNATNLGLTADVTLQPAKYNEITKLQIGAKQLATWGIGCVANGVDTREPAYIKLIDDSIATIEGIIRLSIMDANQLNKVVVVEQRSERFYSDADDKTKSLLLAEYISKYAGEDSYLVIEMYPDSTTAVTIDFDATNTKMILPITVVM